MCCHISAIQEVNCWKKKDMQVWETKIVRVYGVEAKPWRPRGKMIFEQLIFNSCERMNYRNSSRRNGFYHKLWHCYSNTAIPCSVLKHPSFFNNQFNYDFESVIILATTPLFDSQLQTAKIWQYIKQHFRKGHRFNVVSAPATERFHILHTFTGTLYVRQFLCLLLNISSSLA